MNTPRSLKEVFAKCKLFVTGNEKDYYAALNANGKRFNGIWESLAAWCNKNEINGRAYVEWCFASEYPTYPQPSKFLTDYKKNAYRSYGYPDPQYDLTKLKFELMMHRLSKMPEQQDVVAYLLDDLNTFDSVFIYMIAKNLGKQNELPEDILAKARQQIFCHPVYAERFSDILPEELITHGSEPSYN